MSRTYTQRQGGLHSFAGGTVAVFTVPAGELWVIRNISAICESTELFGLQGFELLINGALFVHGRKGADCTALTPYNWEGRQAAVATDVLELVTPDSGWSVLVTGYAFQT